MTDTATGLRERKKQRTRHALASAALRLFAERGYEETTIADIAAAADVSPRTFFGYFASKEDVLFAEIDERLAQVGRRLAERPPGETPLETIRHATVLGMEALVERPGGPGAACARLILDRPALRARALQRLVETQRQIEELLRALCPEMDEIDVVAAAGSAFGGLRSVVDHCRREGYAPDAMRAALDRALTIVERGLASVDALRAPAS
ncbi:TetR/AcrR family transcriptional regulator [Actinomadura atramentaria]|uniref:TetR/AcrR family transcriptional regulator n=1 Tax=Actinomadura atramentaria TaxID=1990 RepID=UPI0003624112|nr:TetR/AcrR family transcriptional regulator [Actinomadura atramentaria]